MDYVDGIVVAVPLAKKDAYVKYAREVAVVFREHGDTRLLECWDDDVSPGTLTSFPMAAVTKEPRSAALGEMPFDGERMIYGGFQMVVNA